MIKVNLGSGFVGLDGWHNYDNSVLAKLSRVPGLVRLLVRLGFLPKGYNDIKWPPIIIHDCRKGIPLSDEEADFVYTSHFLEHIYRHEVFAILKECHRVLKKGARMRIVLPDVDRIIAAYKARESAVSFKDFRDADVAFTQSDYFCANFFAMELNSARRPAWMTRFNEKFLRRHQWMYTKESISALLKAAGFEIIEERAFGDSSLAECARLDAHAEVSFYIEAVK